MKLLLLLIALLSCNTIHCQYISMLQEGNKWSVDTSFCPFPPSNPPNNWTITEQVTIDTELVEINGVTYKQILLDDESSCLLREDGGIVYKYIPSIDEEKILYNFDAQIGDEYPYIGSALVYDICNGVNSNYGIFFLEVMDIRTELIAGENRKVIVLTDQLWPGSEDMLWIEGIGSRAGLGTSWPAWDVTCGSALSCFETGGINYFMYGATSCDNTTLSLLNISEEKTVLYPNPVVQKSVLQLPNEGYADTIRIFNIQGALVKEARLSADHLVIDAMKYKAGIYFYQVILENRVIVSNNFIIR